MNNVTLLAPSTTKNAGGWGSPVPSSIFLHRQESWHQDIIKNVDKTMSCRGYLTTQDLCLYYTHSIDPGIRRWMMRVLAMALVEVLVLSIMFGLGAASGWKQASYNAAASLQKQSEAHSREIEALKSGHQEVLEKESQTRAKELEALKLAHQEALETIVGVRPIEVGEAVILYLPVNGNGKVPVVDDAGTYRLKEGATATWYVIDPYEGSEKEQVAIEVRVSREPLGVTVTLAWPDETHAILCKTEESCLAGKADEIKISWEEDGKAEEEVNRRGDEDSEGLFETVDALFRNILDAFGIELKKN